MRIKLEDSESRMRRRVKFGNECLPHVSVLDIGRRLRIRLRKLHINKKVSKTTETVRAYLVTVAYELLQKTQRC